MIVFATLPSPIREEDPMLLRWIVPISVALHVVVVMLLPVARRAPAPPPAVFELADPPPPPPPAPEPAPDPPREVAATPRATPVHSPSPSIRSAAPNAIATESIAEAVPAAPAAAVDFTATTMSNDGLALGSAGSATTAPAAATTSTARAPAAAPPRFVPAASLSRAPRAPGLDDALERNYPPAARRSGISGTAVLRVQILSDGRTGSVRRVSESFEGFGDACAKTARGARWEPPLDRDGRAVATEITYVCNFEVRS